MPRQRGTPKKSRERKAKIIAEKSIGLHTVEEVAARNNVAVATVYQYVREADPETLALANDFREQLIYKAGLNATAGMDVIAKRIQSDKEPLSSVVSATKLSHEIYRLETGQSTSNTSVKRSPEEMAIEFVRLLIDQRKSLQEVVEIVRRSTSLERFGLTGEDKEAFAARLLTGEVAL